MVYALLLPLLIATQILDDGKYIKIDGSERHQENPIAHV